MSAVAGAGCVDVRLWGKARGLQRMYPVVCHLLDTAALAGALWDGLLGDPGRRRVSGWLDVSASECRQLVCLWAGLHDIGKIIPSFQAQVGEFDVAQMNAGYDSAGAGCVGLRHDLATQWALSGLFAEWGYPGGVAPRLSAYHQIAQLLGGHHGRVHAALSARQLRAALRWQPGLGGGKWAEQRWAHAEALRDLTGAWARPVGVLPGQAAVVVAGLVVLADWLASQEWVIDGRLPALRWVGDREDLERHWAVATAEAAEVVSRAGLGAAAFSGEGFTAQFPVTPTALQADLARELPALAGGAGLVLVTAPPGAGKTEMGLFAGSVLARAVGSGGLCFALPTMATADAMHPRVRAYADANMRGETSLTLVHSLAWLSAHEDGAELGGVGATVADAATRAVSGSWLRGRDRGLIAPISVATVDQLLMGVLPVRHNALRLMGLSGKVVVIDEAHAYGPWMHRLLERLLEWLGALRAPVVLLSATLAGRVASSLVEAYRRGCGFTAPVPLRPRYPGWLHVDADTGRVSTSKQVLSGSSRTLRVEPRTVDWDVTAEHYELTGQRDVVPPEGSRRAELRASLLPVVDNGACALVCCTTVAEAQRTYRYLAGVFPQLVGDRQLWLLHSRYPVWRRDEITTGIERAFGKPTPADLRRRPAPAIVIATQILEMSLDLDFDLVVSDLAPLAQLLQRAGRGFRHERCDRAEWARQQGQRLVVLIPHTDGGVPPRSWGSVYDASLLSRTGEILRRVAADGIRVPERVQPLIDEVYAEDFADSLDGAVERELLQRLDARRAAATLTEEQLAEFTAIPSPQDVVDLAALSNADGPPVDEALITTRLGADSARAVCTYLQPTGESTLDAHGAIPLPGSGRRRLTIDEVTLVLRHTVPLPGSWLAGRGDEHAPPAAWAARPMLAGVAVLPMHRDEHDRWISQVGNRRIHSCDVGLETL